MDEKEDSQLVDKAVVGLLWALFHSLHNAHVMTLLCEPEWDEFLWRIVIGTAPAMGHRFGLNVRLGALKVIGQTIRPTLKHVQQLKSLIISNSPENACFNPGLEHTKPCALAIRGETR